jgi:hypothetical protein
VLLEEDDMNYLTNYDRHNRVKSHNILTMKKKSFDWDFVQLYQKNKLIKINTMIRNEKNKLIRKINSFQE